MTDEVTDAICFDMVVAQRDVARHRIEKLEAALRMVIDWDNTLDWEDGPAWGDLMDIARKALEGV